MRKIASALIGLSLLVLPGCLGNTEPATNVGQNQATLQGKGQCTAHETGDWWYEYRKVGDPGWTQGPLHDFDGCAENGPTEELPLPYGDTITGLDPETTYEYRLCADMETPSDQPVACADKNGPNGTDYETFTTDAVPVPPTGFSPGLVANADLPKAARVVGQLGAKVARVEFHISTEPGPAMDDAVDRFADSGARVLLLAGFHSQVATTAQAQNLADWANRYGCGGTFWQGRTDGELCVRYIEFGNETSYSYQYAGCGEPWYLAECYRQRANWYALRAKDAALALEGTGVGLLVQADHGGSGASTWVDEMYEAVPNLHDYVDGWSVHPYGPNFTDKPLKAIQQTQARGAPATIPVDVTEVGLSSRDGQPVSNNYGWPTNQTYAQAAVALQSVVDGLRNHATIGPRLRHFMVYATYDLQAVGAGTNREWYFGAVKSDETAKGAYTTKVVEVLGL
jgi:hypothetical protein